MSAERNIQVQERWGEEVATKGNLDVLDEILADDFVDHDPAPDQGPGPEGLKGFFRTLRTAFPDLKAEVDEMMASDDEVAIRYTISGTHEGDFMGFAPTGRRVEAAAMQIARFEDGKVKERWGITDQLGLLRQIGALDHVGQ